MEPAKMIVAIIIILVMAVILLNVIFSWSTGGQSFLGEFFNWLTGATRVTP